MLLGILDAKHPWTMGVQLKGALTFLPGLSARRIHECMAKDTVAIAE